VEHIKMDLLQKCPLCTSGEFTPWLASNDHFLTGEAFTIVRCDRCNFLFTNPRPTEQESKKYYESTDYISHSNASQGPFAMLYQVVRKITAKKKVKLVQRFVSEGRILDIGCGTGSFLSAIGKKGFIPTGVEPNETARNFASANQRLQVFETLTEGNFMPKSFKVITLWHVLEHIYPLDETFKTMHRLLDDSGIVVVALPNPESKDARIYKQFWAGYDLPRHIYHFTPATAAALFSRYGFSVAAVLPMYFDSFYISLLSEKYKTGTMNYFRAFYNGVRSNISASFPRNNFSSLIYILKLK
jgi:2-polyprenyl-3-methyl-5-hydroxy-6-metoxy-1,4-benzoquinol methylase